MLVVALIIWGIGFGCLLVPIYVVLKGERLI